MTEQISVGIITKNRKKLLLKLLKELIHFIDTNQIKEIIIAEGSDPNEKLNNEDIEKFTSYINKVVILKSTGEEAFGRNLVLKYCNTKWLCFLDDDCIPKKNIFNTFYQFIRSDNDNNIGLVCGLTYFTGEETKAFKACYLTPFIYPFKIALNKNNPDWGPTVCALFNTNALSNNQRFNTNCPVPVSGTDVDIGIRLNKIGYKVLMCPNAIVYHSTDTWKSLKGNIKRFFIWGRSEVFLVENHPSSILNGNIHWLRDIIKGQKRVSKKRKFSIIEYLFSFLYLFVNTCGYFYQSARNKNIQNIFKRFKYYKCEYMNL